MSEKTQNKFNKGLITDLHPLQTPPDVLTEAQNVEFITTEGNQLILQKRTGNDPEQYQSADVTLSSGFKPLVVKELNNVSYIISHNESTGEGEIGTFPSPNYALFEWTPGTTMGNTVSITDVFDDGLRGQPSFTALPASFDEEYVELSSTPVYSVTVTNTGSERDTYVVTYNEDYFTVNGNTLTLDPAQNGDFDFEFAGTAVAFEPTDVVATIRSSIDNSVYETITWNNFTVYQNTSWWAVNHFYTKTSLTNRNITNHYPVSVNDYPYHYVRVTVAVADGETVALKILGNYHPGTGVPSEINGAYRIYEIVEASNPSALTLVSNIVDASLDYDDGYAVTMTGSSEMLLKVGLFNGSLAWSGNWAGYTFWFTKIYENGVTGGNSNIGGCKGDEDYAEGITKAYHSYYPVEVDPPWPYVRWFLNTDDPPVPFIP